MNLKVKCAKCGEEIEVSEALAHDLVEKTREEDKKRFELAMDKQKIELTEGLRKKWEEDAKIATERLTEEAKEEKERVRKLQEEIMAMTKEMREIKRKEEEREMEMVRKLAQEEEKMRVEMRKRMEEEHTLRDLEKEKKLQDALRMNEELRRKLEQGSQQTQGEVMELALEELLKKEFLGDKIGEVAKGVRGADIIQTVVDKFGRECGKILWETKNAQWSNTWAAKLREDQRNVGAAIAVLVVKNLPEGVENFVFRDGIWVCGWKYVVGLAWAIRINIAQVYAAKKAGEGKNEKMNELYSYLTGTEFKHRVEGIVEAFSNLQTDIEKEKRWFASKWANQEKEIRRIIDNTHGMYGDLQGITGRELPEVRLLDSSEEN